MNNVLQLPTSWQIKTLGEVCVSTNSNITFKNIQDKKGDYPIYGASGVVAYVDFYTKENQSLGIVKDGAGIGRVFLLPPKASVIGTLHYVENNDNLNLKYLFYFLQSINLARYITGSAIPHIYFRDWKKEQIPLPPLEIQKRIVARLESAFEKIEKGSAHLQDAKTKLAKYKQSLLKSAFNGALTATASLRGVEKAETIHKVDCHESANANFHNDDKSVDCHDLTSSKLAMTDKENPKLPQGWTIKTLGEIYDITSSKRVFKDEWKTDGIPFYRARDLVSFLKNEPIKNPLFISETMYNEYSNKYGIPLEDDILVTGVGTIEIPYLVKANEKFYFKDGNILWFKKRASNIFSKYVYYLFLSNLLDTNSKGSTVLTYTIINAKNTKIPLPPLETQKQIVKLLEKHLQHADKTGEFIESALNKAKQLKQSLLKSAFLGKLT